jgi:hypothetical protein
MEFGVRRNFFKDCYKSSVLAGMVVYIDTGRPSITGITLNHTVLEQGFEFTRSGAEDTCEKEPNN